MPLLPPALLFSSRQLLHWQPHSWHLLLLLLLLFPLSREIGFAGIGKAVVVLLSFGCGELRDHVLDMLL